MVSLSNIVWKYRCVHIIARLYDIYFRSKSILLMTAACNDSRNILVRVRDCIDQAQIVYAINSIITYE